MDIVQQKVFGPVQTLQVFDTEDEAVALANDTEFGLSASVWSHDVDRPIWVSRRLEAGLASMDEFCEYKQITQNFR